MEDGLTCFVCTTCGVQYAPTAQPPLQCEICEDERQYLRPSGQQWTTFAKLKQSHRNSIRQEEPGLLSIGMEPAFGINQRALLLRTAVGNILWDCVALLDPGLVELLSAVGGVQAIAVSHPHYYSSIVEWSRAFGGAPIYLHADDRRWVMRPDPAIEFWEGERQNLLGGVSLIRCGGHFDGGAVLHWPDGAARQGALLTGDVIQVAADRKSVSFMYSYPNFIPLSASKVERILSAVEPLAYERIYGAFGDLVIRENAPDVVRRSAQRYLHAIGDSGGATPRL
jgi:glyoxylase-like metal-dependent hydrolase (beta-lactamase superfamily II)